jgi:NADH dehydrogenase [ubiquinone] 1 alpha subcomplex assembly factor 7
MQAPRSKARPSGAALIIDYGPSVTIPISTLRGIRAHQRESPFSRAGQVDLSVDVDFGALVEVALDTSEGVEVHGPVEQGIWLEGMGGRERCEALVKKAEAGGGEKEETKDTTERLRQGWERLAARGPEGMGRLYKVMAIVPERGGLRPVGFGGDV